MPAIVGIKERTHQTGWAGYVCDWRQNGRGCPKPITADFRAFDIVQPANKAVNIPCVGLRLSFSDKSLYSEALRDLIMEFYIGDKYMYESPIWNLDPVTQRPKFEEHKEGELPRIVYVKESVETGWTGRLLLGRSIAIPGRQSFRCNLLVAPPLLSKLRWAEERVPENWYAQITPYVEVLETRDVS